jgi:hypothetical protein
MNFDDSGTASPHPNIFLVLAKKLAETEAKTSGVRQVVDVVIASHFLDVVLGRDWTLRKVAPQAGYDEWMQNRLKPEGMSGIVYGHRVVRLANALFTLLQANVAGFEILRKRFHVRPTKPCFIETEIASVLTVNGFKVEIIGESGMRGRDFDLSATRGEISLSVEVTGKEGASLTANTIRNTLKSKRTQVPASGPAILYIVIREAPKYKTPARAVAAVSQRAILAHQSVNPWRRSTSEISAGMFGILGSSERIAEGLVVLSGLCIALISIT